VIVRCSMSTGRQASLGVVVKLDVRHRGHVNPSLPQDITCPVQADSALHPFGHGLELRACYLMGQPGNEAIPVKVEPQGLEHLSLLALSIDKAPRGESKAGLCAVSRPWTGIDAGPIACRQVQDEC